MKKFHQTLLATSLFVVAGGASAAAFQLAEVSTAGLGRAYAGEAAIADNASVVATNPALMGLLKRPQISVGGIYVDPNIDIKGKTLVGTQLERDATHNNIAPGSFVPTMYGVYPINDKFAVGAGINVNYGLATEYDNDYSAGFLGGKTDLKAVNFNLSASYRILDNLTAGLGFNAVYADADVERRVGALSAAAAGAYTLRARALAAAGQTVQAQRAIAAAQQAASISPDTLLRKIEGDEWGFGWNAGLLYEVNQNHRFGLAYHSKVDIDFDGQYSDAGAGVLGPFAQGNEAGSLTLPLPAYAEFSGYHKLTDQFAIHYSYKWTQWSRFKELSATGNSSNKELFKKEENFKNASRFAIGATYDVNDLLTLRAGFAYDRSAANTHHSISIPDTNRSWYSVGLTYNVTPDFSIDAGYAYLRGTKNSFTEVQDLNGAGSVTSTFTTRARANLYGLNINYRF